MERDRFMSDGPSPEMLKGDSVVRSELPHSKPVSDVASSPSSPIDEGKALNEVRASIRSVEDLPILWPHESPKPTWSKKGLSLRRPRIHEYAGIPSQVESQKAAMGRLNGEQAAVLGDKYAFVDLVHKIGYSAPEQTLIKTSQSSDERLASISDHFPDAEQPIICKPHNGKGGIGITEVSAGELPEFVSSLSQDYIIQTKVPIQEEVRYVRQVDERGGVIRRIYDEKEIPKVVGDGVKTKGQLIREGDVPWYSKAATSLVNANSLRSVVSDGNAVHLSFYGTPHKEGVEWGDQKKHRVDNMDRFMNRFVTDLEKAVGTQLPYLCFDVGVIDPAVLDEPYNFEKMKDNLVPFESQMPFSLWGYVKRSSDTLREKYDTARTLYGSVLTGKKRDFLATRESISKETGFRTQEQDFNFGRGEVTVVRVTPEIQEKDAHEMKPPILFTHGFGQGEGLEPHLALFAEEAGREAIGVLYHGKRVFKAGSERIQMGDEEVKVPRYQAEKTRDIIDALDELGIDKASIIGTSEGVFRASIAAALDPERFEHAILVHPAGTGKDMIGTVAFRVMHQAAMNTVRKIREGREAGKVPHKKTMSGNPVQMFAEGLTVAYGRIGKLIPILGDRIAIAAGAGDAIYSEKRLKRNIREEDIFRLFVTPGNGHGIGRRKAVVHEIVGVLEEMEQQKGIVRNAMQQENGLPTTKPQSTSQE